MNESRYHKPIEDRIVEGTVAILMILGGWLFWKIIYYACKKETR